MKKPVHPNNCSTTLLAFTAENLGHAPGGYG